jgi:WD40 repeat protein
VRIISVSWGWEIASFKQLTPTVTSLAFSRDGKRLAAAGDSLVWVWEVPSGKVVQRLTDRPADTDPALFPKIGLLAFWPDDNTLLTGHANRFWFPRHM